MERLFAMDGKLFGFFSRMADLVLLNLLWLVCCLPVITIGASTTALYYVEMKMVKDEDSYVVKSFFHSFKENFRQSTAVWLCIMLAGVVLYFDFYYSSHMMTAGAKLMAVPLILAAFLILITSCYVFPVMAYFKNSVKGAVKNSLLMALAHLPYTIVIAVITMGPVLLIVISQNNLLAGTFLDIIIGVSLCAWANVHIFNKLFERYIPETVQPEVQ